MLVYNKEGKINVRVVLDDDDDDDDDDSGLLNKCIWSSENKEKSGCWQEGQHVQYIIGLFKV
jgi:hypothetical protein